MKKKLFFSKAVHVGVGCMICALSLASLTGCHKKANPANTIEYSNIMGIAEGTADFKSTDSPEINIKDIKSYVGQEIDYSSGKHFPDFLLTIPRLPLLCPKLLCQSSFPGSFLQRQTDKLQYTGSSNNGSSGENNIGSSNNGSSGENNTGSSNNGSSGGNNTGTHILCSRFS